MNWILLAGSSYTRTTCSVGKVKIAMEKKNPSQIQCPSSHLPAKTTVSHQMHEAFSSILLSCLFGLYMLKKSESRRRVNYCQKSMPVIFYFYHDNECWIVASEDKNGNCSCRRNQTRNKGSLCEKDGLEHFWTRTTAWDSPSVFHSYLLFWQSWTAAWELYFFL